jgi:large subunit ribosomal protein L21
MDKNKDFVIVDIKNSQEKISKGDVIEVSKLDGKEGDSLTFNTVLLSCKGGKTVVGKPAIKEANVKAKIVDQTLGEKIQSKTYKAKSRIRRTVGNRPKLTKIEITSIKF